MTTEWGLANASSAVFLLAVVPISILIYRRLEERARRGALLEPVKIATRADATVRKNLPSPFPWRWQALALCGSMLIAGVAALRPFSGFEDIELSVQGREIAVVVDVSNSMSATDVSPSRIGLVRRKLEDLLRLTNKSGRRDKISLTVFAGVGQLFAPLTADHTVFRSFIRALSSDLVVQGGSDLLGGISEALGSLSKDASDPGLVMIFSDGGEGEIDGSALRAKLREANARIVFLGVGSLEGSRVQLPTGQPVLDRSGAVVISKLNEQALRQAADATGGLYLRVRTDDGDLLRALEYFREALAGTRLGSSDGNSSPSSMRVYRELGPILLKLILLALLVSIACGRKGVLFPVVIGLALSQAIAIAGVARADSASDGNAAWKAYQDGDYARAEALFSALVEQNGDTDPRLLQGLGSSQFKLKEYSRAEQTFKKLVDSAETKERAFDGHYNRGNSLLALGRFDDAIKSYDQALDLVPGEERATHNKAVAEQLKTQPPPQQQQQSSEEQSQGNHSSLQQSSTNDTSGSSSDATSANDSENMDSGSSHSDASDQESSGASDQTGSSQHSSQDSGGSAQSGSAHSTSEPSRDSTGQQSQSQQNDSEASGSTQSNSEASAEQESEQATAQSRGSGQESNASAGSQEDFQGSEDLPTHDPTALRKKEAEAWLETLPDSPMLFPRDSRRPQRQGAYTW